MKRFSLFLSSCALFLASEMALAQTASDYYLPLRVGNYLQFHTSGGSGWGARISTVTIEGSDVISGRRYFRQKDTEVMGGALETHVSGVFWIRKDSVGNVAVGAMSTAGSSNVDSATVASMSIFPNEFLTKGYSRTLPYGGQTWQDSVLSVAETVSGSAGTFNQCLKISSTHFDSTGTAVYREYGYYAYGIGLVKIARTLPVESAHTDELIRYVTTGVSEAAVNQTPQDFSLLQNYPNPFNPSTSIDYQLPVSGLVTLKVFDLLGREAAMLVNDVKKAGSYHLSWDAINLPSGMYVYRITAGNYVSVRKMLLMK
jgi:hypothetical protein